MVLHIDISVFHLLADAYLTYTVAKVLMQRISVAAEPPLSITRGGSKYFVQPSIEPDPANNASRWCIESVLAAAQQHCNERAVKPVGHVSRRCDTTVASVLVTASQCT
eukprot:16330-Heterococcus_DN1.PRE.3